MIFRITTPRFIALSMVKSSETTAGKGPVIVYLISRLSTSGTKQGSVVIAIVWLLKSSHSSQSAASGQLANRER